MEVTKGNFNEAMVGLFYAYELSDYNSECHSNSDIKFHLKSTKLCQDAVEAIREAGYEPKFLLEPIFKKYLPEMSFNAPPDKSLKPELDDSFLINIDGTQAEWGKKYYLEEKGSLHSKAI